jgi:hypothetical protein
MEDAVLCFRPGSNRAHEFPALRHSFAAQPLDESPLQGLYPERPVAACNTKLPIINLPTVKVCSGFSSCHTDGRVARHLGSQPSFEWGKAPIRPVTGRLSLPPVSLTCMSVSRAYAWATHGLTLCTALRDIQADHVSLNSQTDLGPFLYAGWVDGCAGSPSILACLPNIAVLALEPNGRSSSALVTTCKRRFRIPCPYRSFPEHRPCAAHFRCAYQVLETPPLPVTPP